MGFNFKISSHASPYPSPTNQVSSGVSETSSETSGRRREASVVRTGSIASVRRQGFFWILTIPGDLYAMPNVLPQGIRWIRGQRELGAGGYDHWQIFVAFATKKSLRQVVEMFGQGTHAELTYSKAAQDYVWKADTRVDCLR